MDKNKEVINDVEEIEENEEVVEVIKPKWSLKKKALVIGGGIGALILGALALGFGKSKNEQDEESQEIENSDGETAESNEVVINENTEV